MKNSPWNARFTRRSFVKLAGIATGTAAIGDFAPVLAAGSAPRVGVMLPATTRHPKLSEHFLAGLQTALRTSEDGSVANLIVERVSPGYASALRASERLLETHHVDLVVGFTSAAIASQLNDLYQRHDRLLLVSNLGAHVIRPDETGSHVLYHSLDLWQANWHLGQWTAQHTGQTALVAMSFYDSGFDLPYTFRLGFEHAGGTVLDTLVSHRPIDSDDLGPMMAAIEETQPDVVYAAYNGPEAVEFLEAYAAHGFSGRVPLVGTPYLVEQTAAWPVTTCLPWTRKLVQANNRIFEAAYRRGTGSAPDSLAALGYDTGRLIAHVAGFGSGDKSSRLAERGLSGSRGMIAISEDGCITSGPLYVCHLQPDSNATNAITLAEFQPADDAAIRQQIATSSPKTGWSHPYLCI